MAAINKYRAGLRSLFRRIGSFFGLNWQEGLNQVRTIFPIDTVLAVVQIQLIYWADAIAAFDPDRR